MNILLRGLALTLLAITCGASVQAQTGLLLATQDSTYWIRADATGAIQVARGADIIVPRATGFWRLGVRAPAWLDALSLGSQLTELLYPHREPSYCFGATLWAAPANAQAVIIAPPRRPYSEEDCGSGDRGVGDAHVQFVGPDHVAVAAGYVTDERCGASARTDVLRIDEIVTHGWYYTWADAQDTVPGAAQAPQTELPDTAHVYDFIGRGIHRRDGAWRWYDRFGSMCCACGGWTFEHPVSGAPPGADVVGIREPRVDLQTVRRLVPNATDAHAAPGGEWILAVVGPTNTESEIGGHLGAATLVLLTDRGTRAALTLELALPPVMVQWARGAHVARWDAQLPALLAAPPPPDPAPPWQRDPPFSRFARLHIGSITHVGEEIRFTSADSALPGVVHDLSTGAWTLRRMSGAPGTWPVRPERGDTVILAPGVALIRNGTAVPYAVLDLASGATTPLRADTTGAGMIPYSTVPGRWTSDGNRIWFAMSPHAEVDRETGAALLEYDIARRTLRHFAQLPRPWLDAEVLAYGLHRVWLASCDPYADACTSGISAFDSAGSWLHYSASEGDFPSGRVHALNELAGAMWVATEHGVARLDTACCTGAEAVRWLTLIDHIDSVQIDLREHESHPDPIDIAIDALLAAFSIERSPSRVRALRAADPIPFLQFAIDYYTADSSLRDVPAATVTQVVTELRNAGDSAAANIVAARYRAAGG